jgi:DNA helicase-2/ATP-dependent DNA helicase PcrA
METRLDLTTLNEPQVEAVLHGPGPLVVFAGAGSGKTRVIVHRIAHLVLDHGIPAWRILAVTFTNRAAGEMKERLDRLVPGAARDLAVGTFHSTCARLLRRHSQELRLSRDFAIYDDGDQKAMISRVLKDLSLDEKRIPPKMVASIINQAKNEMQGPEDVPLTGLDAEHIRGVFREYEKRMAKANALDFGDLIYQMVRALEANEALRMQLAGRFAHLLVDEFQDTNHAQFRLVRALASVHRNLVVVGDDDQSIYRWRGADRRNILDFRRYFPDAQIVKLEQNYRSTKRILRVAHAVIEKNVDREPKQLWTDNADGSKIKVLRCGSERDEAEIVVRAARELKNESKPLRSLAVFYRIHAQSRVLEEALRAARIPYRVVGGVRFYDRAEVKDLLAYLRLVANPEDDVSFLRVVNVPTRGIGKTSLDRLLDDAATHGTGVWEAAKRAAAGKGGSAIGRFVELIETLRDKAPALLSPQSESGEAVGLADFARLVLTESGYEKALKEENTAESDARLENLASLVGSMQEFEDSEDDDRPSVTSPSLATPDDAPTAKLGLLTRFLETVTLQSEPEEAGGDQKDQVTLMTVHAAKGLEFPRVIVVGLEEQLFPFRGVNDGEGPEELEEERRLAYVAFTRAEQSLTLTWATSRYVFGNLRLGTISRFLDELPLQDIEQRGEGTGMRPHTTAPMGQRSSSWGGYGSGGGNYGSGGGNYRSGSGQYLSGGSGHPPPSSYDKGSLPREGSLEYGDGFERRSLRGIAPMRQAPPVEKEVAGFKKGMKVRHVRYGVGKVYSVEGGTPPTVTVDFPGHGTKQIVAKYLEPA